RRGLRPRRRGLARALVELRRRRALRALGLCRQGLLDTPNQKPLVWALGALARRRLEALPQLRQRQRLEVLLLRLGGRALRLRAHDSLLVGRWVHVGLHARARRSRVGVRVPRGARARSGQARSRRSKHARSTARGSLVTKLKHPSASSHGCTSTRSSAVTPPARARS